MAMTMMMRKSKVAEEQETSRKRNYDVANGNDDDDDDDGEHKANLYRDPDYSADNNSSIHERNKIRRIENDAKTKVVNKVSEIINREFTRSLREKEEELENIDSRILQVRKALHLVRYGAISNFYYPTVKSKCDSDHVSIHPAVRRLLGGKKPKSTTSVTSKTTATSTTTSAAAVDAIAATTTATTFTTITTPVTVTVASTTTTTTSAKTPQTLPGYVPPNAKTEPIVMEPRGSQFKFKRRFIVGNVSKWIRCDERGQDRSTHKWMLYVRGDRDNPDVSDVVSKVRFMIHSSYHPHDLVEVKDSPFHLTRRGWGEFPARIQIHFKHPRDKPVDVIHNLKLDRTYTGLQTLGSETHVDIWIHSSDTCSSVKIEPIEPEEAPNLGGSVFSHTVETDLRRPKTTPISLLNNKHSVLIKNKPALKAINNESMTTATTATATTTPTITCSTTTTSTNGKQQQSLLIKNNEGSSPKQQTTFIRCNDKSGKVYYLPVNLFPNNQTRPPSKRVISTNTTSSLKGVNGGGGAGGSPGSKFVFLQDGQVKVVKSCPNSRSGSPERSLPSSSLKPGASLLRKVHTPSSPTPVSSSLLSTSSNNQLTDLEKGVPEISIATWKTLLGRCGDETQAEIENRVAKKGINFLKRQTEYLVFLHQKVLKLRSKDFPSWERMTSYIAQFLPLVTHIAKDPLYRALHPYSASSVSEYLSWNIGKRAASEWLRAKTIHRIIHRAQDLSDTRFEISTRLIWKHLRMSGFSVCEDSIQTIEEPVVENRFSTWTLPTIEFNSDIFSRPLKSDHEDDNSFIDVLSVIDGKKELFKKKEQGRKEGQGHLPLNAALPKTRTCLMFPEDGDGSFRYVGETAKALGIELVQEELNNKVYYPMAQKLIYKACKSFCELMIRESFKCANERSSRMVQLQDVRRAIRRDPSLKIFSNAGLGTLSEPQQQP